MPKKRLTEEGVRKLKPPPPGKQVDYYDAIMPGLVLRLNYGGKKTWRALYYVPSIAKSGKRKGQRISMPTTRELGRYPILKLKEARDRARQFLADPLRAVQGAVQAAGLESIENERVRAASKYAAFAAHSIAPQAFLYRHFEHNGDLLYVGITADIPQRLLSHFRHSGWSGEICFIVIEPFASREEALDAEEIAIRTEWPKYNLAHNGERHPVAELRRFAKRTLAEPT